MFVFEICKLFALVPIVERCDVTGLRAYLNLIVFATKNVKICKNKKHGYDILPVTAICKKEIHFSLFIVASSIFVCDQRNGIMKCFFFTRC